MRRYVVAGPTSSAEHLVMATNLAPQTCNIQQDRVPQAHQWYDHVSFLHENWLHSPILILLGNASMHGHRYISMKNKTSHISCLLRLSYFSKLAVEGDCLAGTAYIQVCKMNSLL